MFWSNANRKLHSDKNDEDLKKRGSKADLWYHTRIEVYEKIKREFEPE